MPFSHLAFSNVFLSGFPYQLTYAQTEDMFQMFNGPFSHNIHRHTSEDIISYLHVGKTTSEPLLMLSTNNTSHSSY